MFHPTTFQYLSPTDEQKAKMARVRAATEAYAAVLVQELPRFPDKTYAMRQLREILMWSNVTITRLYDGTPRVDGLNDDRR